MRTFYIKKIEKALRILPSLCGVQIKKPFIEQAPYKLELPHHLAASPLQPICQGELQTKGKALRKAIDAKCHEIEALGASYTNPLAGHPPEVFRQMDVTDLVLQYLPIGMSLVDAETLLKASGFTVSIDSKSDLQPKRNAGVYGHLQLVADVHWFTSFGISAKSNAPENQNIFLMNAVFRK